MVAVERRPKEPTRAQISERRQNALALLALLCIWAGMTLVANPLGDFPLNDDWSYARAVRSLVEDGRFALTGWTSMPLVTQVLWGGVFANWFGFSFTVLRFSTLVLGGLGLVVAYGLFRTTWNSPALALFAALTIACNPLYFQLANSFMTDVPFFAVALASVLVLARSLEMNSWRQWALGLALAYAGILIRQIGLCVPMATGMVLIWKQGVRPRTIAAALLPSLVALAILYLYRTWLVANDNLPAAYDVQGNAIFALIAQHPDAVVAKIAENVLIVVMYCGLFLAPVLILVVPAIWTTLSRSMRLVTTTLTVSSVSLLMFILQVLQRQMPLTGNLLGVGGLGPLTLRDVYLLGLPHFPEAPSSFWETVTFVSICSAVLLIQAVAISVTRYRRSAGRYLIGLVSVAAGLYFAPHSLIYLFDRYILFLLPLFLVILIGGLGISRVPISRRRWLLAAFSLILFGSLAVSATHDYMEWNRVRWQTLRTLVDDQHIPPTEIDGGFEFNMFYLFPQFWHRAWSLYHDQYLVAFGPVAGYEIVQEKQVATWLPFGRIRIVLMSKVIGLRRPDDQ